LPAIAWIPPYAAQVPIAMTAVARGVSRSSHSVAVIGALRDARKDAAHKHHPIGYGMRP
jgi:hypothetical protein